MKHRQTLNQLLTRWWHTSVLQVQDQPARQLAPAQHTVEADGVGTMFANADYGRGTVVLGGPGWSVDLTEYDARTLAHALRWASDDLAEHQDPGTGETS